MIFKGEKGGWLSGGGGEEEEEASLLKEMLIFLSNGLQEGL